MKLIHPWILPFILNPNNPNLEMVVIALWVRLDCDLNLVGRIKLCSCDDYMTFSSIFHGGL